MKSEPLHDMIDACRPGHDDLDQPEFSELAQALSEDSKLQRVFARSQEFDTTLRTTFQAVAPPPGFAERLLASLDQFEEEPAVADVETAVEPAKRTSRRWFTVRAGMASLATVAAVVSIWFAMPQQKSTPSDRAVAERVDRWNEDFDEADWQRIADVSSPQDFPAWKPLELRSDDRWQWVLKQRTLCYDLNMTPQENGEIVRLFVSKPTSTEVFPPSPPAGYPSPNGWHVGAWQANGRVYYLAVYAHRDSKLLYSRVIGSRINAA
ncbi:MAG TPA: hypothetical protein P5307_02645 [Pirellulaceae bacterium]|nr:hypothetical protein [Planctomycetales bacterium]MCB9938193.1 hypothetical protein [Planctomycetaceae bacterium]HRX77929.1 hypothetical protein [Pirellulaceae bacterium]